MDKHLLDALKVAKSNLPGWAYAMLKKQAEKTLDTGKEIDPAAMWFNFLKDVIKNQPHQDQLTRIYFDKEVGVEKAKAWLEANNFDSSKMSESPEQIMFTQRDADDFERDLPDMPIELDKGVTGYVGVLKKADERVTKSLNDPHYAQTGGAHQHHMNRLGLDTTIGRGGHSHCFVLPTGEVLTSEYCGEHYHGVMPDAENTASDGSHTHKVTLPNGEVVETEKDGAHDHEMFVTYTANDGAHRHALKMPDGSTILSMSPKDYAEKFGPFKADLYEEEEARRIASPKDPPMLVDVLEPVIEKAESFKPPAGVQAAAKRGLELREKFGRGGTAVGIARARDLANGKNIPVDTLKRMKAFFDRHEENKDTPPEEGNGKIAWLLWGGDPGRRWAESKLRQVESTEKGCACKALTFVGHEASPLDKARKEHLTGQVGELFNELYLKAIGVSREDIDLITCEEIEAGDKELPPKGESVIVALGKAAREELGERADFYLPHPSAIKRHKDSGEVGRKARGIRKRLDELQQTKRESDTAPIVKEAGDEEGEPRVVPIVKADEEERLVYGVVLDPYIVDAHNDWIPPKQVQDTAHGWMRKSRVIGLQHTVKAKAHAVESFLVQYPSAEDYKQARENLPHKAYKMQFGDDVVHSGAWIVATKVEDDGLWQAIKDGKITGYSIGGFGEKSEASTTSMPEVEFVTLSEEESVL